MSIKNILCFGDSNTWGFVPGAFDPETLYMKRYSILERWPGILRDILGADYHIIEEGLNGRTTNVEYPDYLEEVGHPTYCPVYILTLP